MALFSRLFGKKKAELSESELETINFNQLMEWLKERYQEKLLHTEMDKEFEQYTTKLKEKAWSIKCILHKWERKSGSLYKNYPPDEVNFFFLESKRLLEMLNENITLKTVSAFNKNISEKLNSFFTEISEGAFSQNYSLLISDDSAEQQLTAEDLEEEEFEEKPLKKSLENSKEKSAEKKEKIIDISVVNDSISDGDSLLINPLLKEMIFLNQLRKEFEKNVEQSGLLKVKNLIINAAELDEQIKESNYKITQLKEELMGKKERLKMAQQSYEEKKSQYTQLSSDVNFPLLNKVEAQHKHLVSKMEENDDAVFVFFSKLKLALKQYLDVDQERKIVRGYIDNPPLVFYADKRLEILEILPKLNSAVAIGRIKLDRDSATQLRDCTVKVNSGYLEELQEKHFHLAKEMDQLELNSQNKNMLLKIEDVRYRLDHFRQQVEKMEQDIAVIEEEMQTRFFQQKNKLDEFTFKVNEILGKNVEIKI